MDSLDDELDAALLASPASLDSLSHSPPPQTTSFRLLDLPTELISNVCRFVALLKYSYSESRRPRPSTLALLGSSSSLLRELTSPLLWRGELGIGQRPLLGTGNRPAGSPPRDPKIELCRYVRITFQTSVSNIRTSIANLRKHQARYAGVTSLDLVVPSPDPTAHPSLSAQDILSPLSIFHNIVQLSVRLSAGANRSLALDTPLPALSNLVTVSLRGCQTSWLATFANLPDVKSLNVTLAGEQALVGWMPNAAWGRLEEFAMEVSPTLEGVSPLDEALFGLRIPEDARLRALTIAVRLQLQHPARLMAFSLISPSIDTFSNLPFLLSLTIDEYTTIPPDAISILARSFPLLTTLAFKDRTVWIGTKAAHLEALSSFRHLTRLECPRWPEDDPEAWTGQNDMAMEAGEHVSTLSLIGLGGRYSEEQWYRIVRDDLGKPTRVDEVEFYQTDLHRQD